MQEEPHHNRGKFSCKAKKLIKFEDLESADM